MSIEVKPDGAEPSPESVGLSSEGLARIDAALAAYVAEGEIPGAVIVVARHGRIVHRAAVGHSNIAAGAPDRLDTIFPIFSMTKPVTAVAMMTLFEEGVWGPDDPIARHLPEFADIKGPDGAAPDHPPTLRELMTHTAGLGYGIGPGPHDATDKAYIAAGVWQAQDLADLSRRVASVPLATQPGTTWRYSIGMDIEGALIERATGKTLPDFMRERIFAPLGMTDTDFWVPPERQARLATLYHRYGVTELTVLEHPGFRRDGRALPKIASGGGGLYSTAGDYARFAQMLLNRGALDGARILAPASVELMTANHLPAAIMEAGVEAGMQHIGPGAGYGFNGAVFTDPKAAGVAVGAGTYQWDGAGGAWFWVDPTHDLLFVGMGHRMLQDGMPRLQALTQQWIAQALL